MAYNALNNLIDAYIYANGVQAITGQILNGVLKQMVAQLGSGYHLMGVAGPQTVPASEDYAMAYFAASAGEYTSFGNITLAAGEVAVLLTSGNGSWEKRTIYVVPTGTADLENSAGFITNAVTDLVNYYTKTEMDDTLADYPTLEALETALEDYYTKTEIDEQMATRYTKSEVDTKFGDYYRKVETYDKDEVDSIVAALSRQEYIVAWDGLAAPDVSAIPAGVTVTYSGTTYTGTLAASASTVNKIYMVHNGTAYDMYATAQDSTYSWVPMGTTSVDLSQYATKAEVSQLQQEVDEESYLTASIQSKFLLHYTHNGNGTFGQNPNRNAITTPLKFDDDIVVSVKSGYKYTIQYFDGYTTGTAHYLREVPWQTGNTTIPAGSYWTMVVAKIDNSATSEATSKKVYFDGVADGGLILERFNDIDSEIAGTNNRITGIENDISHTIVKNERISAGSTQQIVRLGALDSGTKVHIRVSNESGGSITHFYLLYKTTDMSIVQQWSGPFSADITIADSAEYALYTNIAAGGNLSYDLYIEVNGEAVDSLYTGIEQNAADIERLDAKTDYITTTVNVEQTEPTQNVIAIDDVYAGTRISIKCKIVSGQPSGSWFFQFLGQNWQDEEEHTFDIANDGNYKFYTNYGESTTVTDFVYDVQIKRIGEARIDNDVVEDIKSVVDLGDAELYGEYGTPVSPIFKFDTFKTSRVNASSQQINHIGTLPAGTTIRLVVYNFVVNSGSGLFIHNIAYNKHDGMGYYNLATMQYSGTIETTLEEELDIYTISNPAPNVSVNYDLICQYGTALPQSSRDTYIAVWKDSVVAKDSILKSIHISAPNAGTYTFGIGTVDWRPIAIVSKTFDLTLSTGEQTIDLRDKKIILRAGEKVFLYVNKNGKDGLSGYSIGSSDERFLFGKESGLLSEYSGMGMAFEASYASIDSVFALKDSVQIIEDNVASNSETIQSISSSLNVVKDANGNNYEIMVVNGVLTPVLMQYSKALIMGNSLSLGMDRYDNPYGMLATRANMDFVSHILSSLQAKVPAATVYKEVSSYTLESGLLDTDFDAMFASISVWDFDLIVYQGGENVSVNGYSQYEQALTNLVTYLKGKCPTAKFVITGVVLADVPVLENSAKNVAKNTGAKYVYCNGHTPDVTIGVSNIWYNKISNTYLPSAYSQQTHPNDLGFLNLANAILGAFGYSQIEKKHNITVSSASANYSCPAIGVEGGIVTIKTYGNAAPTISVTDGNGNPLTVTHYKLSDFDYDNRFADGTTDPATYSSVFDMPATDVTITIG